jgi:hypothetical protein
MKEIIIVRENISKIKNFLDQEHINYEISHEINDKLREYIETKSKENIFANYGEAIKDKEREKEIALWDQADEEDEEELSKKYAR